MGCIAQYAIPQHAFAVRQKCVSRDRRCGREGVVSAPSSTSRLLERGFQQVNLGASRHGRSRSGAFRLGMNCCSPGDIGVHRERRGLYGLCPCAPRVGVGLRRLAGGEAGWGLKMAGGVCYSAGKRGGVHRNAGQGVLQPAKEAVHLAVSLGLFLSLDKYLSNLFAEASIRFPSALFGMISLFLLLSLLSAISSDAAAWVEAFFSPAILFIQRWLPLFYVPSLVVVPLAVKGIPASAAAKIVAIFVGGWIASLAVAGYTAVRVRAMVKTELLPGEPVLKPTPFSSYELSSWVVVMLLSFGLAISRPTALGPVATTSLPYLLSATVVGYLVGSSLPGEAKKVLHPIITCAITADLAALALGVCSGSGFEAALGGASDDMMKLMWDMCRGYLTKSAASPGAGDLLMGFLGTVILSFAFSMFRQRKVVQRHAAEIVTAVVVSSIFSLYSTAAAGRLLGLSPSITCAIVPRCVTVALALPIASLLEGSNPSLTAAVVVLTGLVGANFAQTLMDKFGFKDPISRGMATASSAHGLGTAALAAKEPEALPFCAIAYGLTGILSTLLCTLPLVQTSLLVLAGAS